MALYHSDLTENGMRGNSNQIRSWIFPFPVAALLPLCPPPTPSIMFPKSFLVLKLVGLAFSLVSKRLILLISAKFHRLTYRPIPNPKNVVVIGGSFAGCFLAKRLSECLPTGYTVVLIEKHSHFHFTWNFPRVTVLKGHESKAFIPYPEKPRDAPDGAYFFKQATVVSIEAGRVKLSDGESIECEYLAIATGSQKRYPGALDANGKLECMRFFAGRQEAIETAQRIVVVGGGAAGVEVAGDIKSKYPEKEVTLVHSRTHLLNTFGEGLHIRTKAALEELGVELYLGERVVKGLGLNGPGEMTLTSGKILKCDLLVRSTPSSNHSRINSRSHPD